MFLKAPTIQVYFSSVTTFSVNRKATTKLLFIKLTLYGSSEIIMQVNVSYSERNVEDRQHTNLKKKALKEITKKRDTEK